MTLKELQPQLLELSSVEKAQVIQFLLQNLSYKSNLTLYISLNN